MVDQLFTYDVFLSYSPKDRGAASALAHKLRKDGIKVWFDQWEITSADSPAGRIQKDGLERSRSLILFISQNVSKSVWATFERQTLLFRDPTSKSRRFFPIKLDDSECPTFLKSYAYVVWSPHDENQYLRLLSLVSKTIQSDTNQFPHIENIRVLEGHLKGVTSVIFSTDDKFLFSASIDKTIRIWDSSSGNCTRILEGHSEAVREVSVSRDCKLAVTCSDDKTVRIWDVGTGKCRRILVGHSTAVSGVAISPNGESVVSCASDGTIRIWDAKEGNCLKVLDSHVNSVQKVAISFDSLLLVSASLDKSIRIWEITTGKCLRVLNGHVGSVQDVAISRDGKFVVSGSSDNTVRLWDLERGKCVRVFEGPEDSVQKVAISPEGEFIIAGSNDKKLRIWDSNRGQCFQVLEAHSNWICGISISSNGKLIASGSFDNTVALWDAFSLVDSIKLLSPDASTTLEDEYEFYTNAKVLLVGESGVGKSGLANRLTQNRFIETSSTDGVWATQISLPNVIRTDHTEREVWLWDFAGQSDYRLIHQLFMDETALAVLVFNPQTDNPFETLRQWDKDLSNAARRPFQKLLVAGRCDRGGLVVSGKRLDEFKRERGFAKYLETSAKTGAGCNELREEIVKNINWDEIPHMSSPRIFKILKKEIYRLKNEGRSLLTLSEIRQNLELRLMHESFTLEELKAVLGLLAGSGIVWKLEFGDFILLYPEKINSYAAALIRSVRSHVDEIGCIPEEKLLRGDLDFQDVTRLSPRDEEIVIRAMYQILITHGLCLREYTESGVLLVLPSYFRRERPELSTHPSTLITYKFSGMLDEIYATLIVKLHYSSAFEKDQLWRYAADFKTLDGKRVGLKMSRQHEGMGELEVFFERTVPDATKALFIRYVHDHLKEKDDNLVRTRHYICSSCEEPFENTRAVQIRLEKGFKDIVCPACEEKIILWDLLEEKFASRKVKQLVREMEEQAKIAIDNESKELILIGHAYAIVGEAGQIFRQTSNSDWGIDGEIEFKDKSGKTTGKRVYLQLKSGNSYLQRRGSTRRSFFNVRSGYAEYWMKQEYPVMLVIHNSVDEILWMNVTEYLKKHGSDVRKIPFDGEPFTALSLVNLRDKILSENEKIMARSPDTHKALKAVNLGQKLLKQEKLDDAIISFQNALSLYPSQEKARKGLFQIAHRSSGDNEVRTDLAINTLLGVAPDWLAAQICEQVELTEVRMDSEITIDLKVDTVPITVIAAETNGFGWEAEVTPVEAIETESEPIKLSLKLKEKVGNRITLIAKNRDIPWGLYVLTVRFQADGREYWSMAQSISNEEPRIPYLAGPPIRRPEQFFGRQRMIKDVKVWLEEYSVVLLGPRRSGKTSFLYQLQQAFEKDRWTTVFIDLHGFLDLSPSEMSAALRKKIYSACVNGECDKPLNLQDLQTNLQKADIRNLLILLDEISVLAHYPLVSLHLRAMSKWLQPETRLIVAGTASDFSTVTKYALDKGSPPFNEFKRCELEEISHRDARELLEKPVLGNYRYEKKAVEAIIDLCGGQPFYLNILGALTLKTVRSSSEVRRDLRFEDVQIARNEAIYELTPWFQELLAELAPGTEAFLLKIIKQDISNMLPSHQETLRNSGLMVGLRQTQRLFPLFLDWWNSNIKDK